jgi:hypothetical protein
VLTGGFGLKETSYTASSSRRPSQVPSDKRSRNRTCDSPATNGTGSLRTGPIAFKLPLPKQADFLGDFLPSVARAAHEIFFNELQPKVIVFEDDQLVQSKQNVQAERRKSRIFPTTIWECRR